MFRQRKLTSYLPMLTFLACTATNVTAQTPSPLLGFFEGQNDIGTVLQPGSAEYDASARAYTVTGSGENMWFGTDDFHYVWKKVSGDVTLSADINLITGGDNHRKGVLMIRQSLDPDSPYASAALHGDGLTALQFRYEKGAPTHEVESNVSAPTRLRLQKRGDYFYLWIASEGKEAQFAGGSTQVLLQAPFYVGIGVCAHNKDATQKASFTNVDLSTTMASPSATAEHYSTVETITVASTDARSAYVTHDRLASPSWSAEGAGILFEDGGKMQQVPVAGGSAQRAEGDLPESYLQERSPDGRYIYLSSNRSGTMQIWRTAPDGSGAEQLTHDNNNNASPHLSPDGKEMVFLSYESKLMIVPNEADVMLRVFSLGDRKVKTIAKLVGGQKTLGAHPWSPDGKQLTFISYQTIAP